MGLKGGAFGNTLGDTHWEAKEHFGNILGDTYWELKEHFGNLLGIYWEL